MAVKYRGDGKYTALSTDAKPTATQIAANVIIEETDTHNQYINNGTAWVLYRAASKTEVYSNKSISGASNTLANIPLNSLANVAIASPASGEVIQYNGANWVNAVAAGGGGAGGGGFSAGGTITKSGNGTNNIISIAHGLSSTPEIFFALPLNDAARGIISYSADATNINIAYPIAPAAGSNNLSYVWGAGFANVAELGFTPTSTTILENKTISADTNPMPAIWPGYYYVIYKAGSTVKCRDNTTGTTVSSHATDFNVPMQFALDNGVRKDIYVANGTYNVAAGTDLLFKFPETRIKFDPGAIITVPNGYTGHLLNFTRVLADTTSLSNIIIDGGRYVEAGTPVNAWDCIYLNNTNPQTPVPGTTAVFFCKFMNMYIRNAGNAIHLRSAGDRGWINGNMFQNITIDNQKCGIRFTYVGTNSGANGANRNHFHNVIMQCNANSTDGGIIDISGEANVFNDVKVWDVIAGATSCNITPKAMDTLIVGSMVATANFSDLGTRTMIIENTIPQIYPFLNSPSRRKWGVFQGTGNTPTHFRGILTNMTEVSGHTASESPTSSADGRGTRVETPATANTAAGWKTSTWVTMRDWRPRLKARFRLTSATGVRMFIGFKVASADLTADNYLSADYGIGLGVDSTLANFRLLRNDNVGNTVTASTGVAVDTAVREVEIWWDASSPMLRWNYKMQVPGSVSAIDNTLGFGYNTDIPSDTATLRAVVQVGTTGPAVKGLDLYYLEVESDK
jgi:hypothetical protein